MSSNQVEALVTGRRRSADLDKNLLELHVYLVPVERWQKFRHLASGTVMNESISVGFVRVTPELNLHGLRKEMAMQLGGPQFAGEDLAFLKNVGRNFTQIKMHQEKQLKSKHFAPPYAKDPEIFLLNIKKLEKIETTTAFISIDSQDSINGVARSDETPTAAAERQQQIEQLSALILPALTMTPQQALQTAPPEQQAEDSGVLSEDERSDDDTARPPLQRSPDLRLVQAVQDSFDSSKPDEDSDKMDRRFFEESAPALIEMIPSLDFRDQDEPPAPERPAEEVATSPPKSVASNSPPGSKKKAAASPPRRAVQPTPSSPGDSFAPQISQAGDFSVTFVILEDELQQSAPPVVPPASVPPLQLRREPDAALDEAEEEEAEEPQQFLLFKSGSRGKKQPSQEVEVLKKELRVVSQKNKEEEAKRHALVERASDLQNRIRVRKEKKQTALRSQLLAAKRAQVPLESACAQLRLELDAAHRELLSGLAGGREASLTRIKDGPSRKADLKLNACRLQQEIKHLDRNVSSVRVRLESEIKLKTKVEMEIRQCRADLKEKKTVVASLRSTCHLPALQHNNRYTAISKV